MAAATNTYRELQPIQSWEGTNRVTGPRLRDHFAESNHLYIRNRPVLVFPNVTPEVFAHIERAHSIMGQLSKSESVTMTFDAARELVDRELISLGKTVTISCDQTPWACSFKLSRDDRTLTIALTSPETGRLIITADQSELVTDTAALCNAVEQLGKPLTLRPDQRLFLRDLKGRQFVASKVFKIIPNADRCLTIASNRGRNFKVTNGESLPFAQESQCLVLSSETGMTISVAKIKTPQSASGDVGFKAISDDRKDEKN